MKPIVVYRIQDKFGRGPFRPGFSQRWLDDELTQGKTELPSWMEEFGADLIIKRGRPGEYYGSACRSLEWLDRWFSFSEQQRLAALGFMTVSLTVTRLLAHSECQIVFAIDHPLNHSIVIIPWRFACVSL